MALLKSHHVNVGSSRTYTFDDYEQKKLDFLRGIEEQAQDILSNARQEAENIREDARKDGLKKAEQEIETLKSNAKVQGHEEGTAKAKEEVKVENQQYIEANLSPLVNKFKTITEQLEQYSQSFSDKAAEEILSTSLHLAEAVLLCEPQFNADVLKARILKAISHLRLGAEVQIKVHPEDKKLADEHISSIMEDLGKILHVNFTEDESLNKGDVTISSGDAQVQLTSIEQWKKLLSELKLGDEQ